MTQTEHTFFLHVCDTCGRTEVYERDAEGRHCKDTVERTEEERRDMAENRDWPIEEVPKKKECRGKWVTSRMFPEDDIFDVHERPEDFERNRMGPTLEPITIKVDGEELDAELKDLELEEPDIEEDIRFTAEVSNPQVVEEIRKGDRTEFSVKMKPLTPEEAEEIKEAEKEQ